MSRRLIFLFSILGCLCANAQSIDLRGTISNGDGDPISGAVVTLLGQGLKDTTRDNGAYAFTQATSIRLPHSAAAGQISLTANLLEIKLTRPSPITIEIFDLKGQLLKTETRDIQEAGTYHWDITNEYTSDQLLIIRASAGEGTSTFRFMPLAGKYDGLTEVKSAFSQGAPLAKTAPAVDSLEVKASGYSTKIVPIESYDGTIDVSLNAADKWGGMGNPPVKSSGCGKPQGITSGRNTIRINNQDRYYLIDIPSNYDSDTPHLIIYTPHFGGGAPEDVRNNNYYFLKPFTQEDNKPTVFIAPLNSNSEVDHRQFEALMAHAEENLCIDTTRIFVTGFSYGGMVTYSLSTNHQHKIRAASGLAPANWNIWLPDQKLEEPMAWMQTTGMRDNTCAWINNEAQKRGGKFIALEKAANNGCDIPSEIPTWKNGGHTCYEFEGCDEGYPVKICTSGEGHTDIGKDPGSNDLWIPPESWEFFKRF